MEISMIEFNIESKKETWRTPLLNHFRIVYLNFLVQLGGDAAVISLSTAVLTILIASQKQLFR